MQQRAVAKIEGTSQNEVQGEASFSQDGDKITLKIDITDAAPGIHGVHIHETGDCGDDGKSAGGHWNPTDAEHGKWGEGEFHLGDLGNMAVIKDGRGYIERTTDLWEIGTDSDLDIVGKAIIVHGGQDDFETQPTGAAGPRIGCGVIELQQ
jgi:Cu-Zn family superoxide dismutase